MSPNNWGMEDVTLNQKIVASARTWRGTRFIHQGRRKAAGADPGGVDCLGLLIGVAEELGLTAQDGRLLAGHDVAAYSKSPDGAALMARLDELLIPIPPEDTQPGDVALFALDSVPQHLAILSDYAPGVPGMIHAFAPVRRVVEHRMDEGWQKRLVRLYRCA